MEDLVKMVMVMVMLLMGSEMKVKTEMKVRSVKAQNY